MSTVGSAASFGKAASVQSMEGAASNLGEHLLQPGGCPDIAGKAGINIYDARTRQAQCGAALEGQRLGRPHSLLTNTAEEDLR